VKGGREEGRERRGVGQAGKGLGPSRRFGLKHPSHFFSSASVRAPWTPPPATSWASCSGRRPASRSASCAPCESAPPPRKSKNFVPPRSRVRSCDPAPLWLGICRPRGRSLARLRPPPAQGSPSEPCAPPRARACDPCARHPRRATPPLRSAQGALLLGRVRVPTTGGRAPIADPPQPPSPSMLAPSRMAGGGRRRCPQLRDGESPHPAESRSAPHFPPLTPRPPSPFLPPQPRDGHRDERRAARLHCSQGDELDELDDARRLRPLVVPRRCGRDPGPQPPPPPAPPLQAPAPQPRGAPARERRPGAPRPRHVHGVEDQQA
jgi:hypothetical protein